MLTHYVDNLEEGEGTFVSKLRFQLRDASADTIQAAAELLYVHCLITSTEAIKGKNKAALVETVVAAQATDAGLSSRSFRLPVKAMEPSVTTADTRKPRTHRQIG